MSKAEAMHIANLLLYYDDLIAYISNRTGNRQVAIEVVQETYLKVLQKSEQFEHLEHPVAFLKKVSFHIALDYLKKNQHHQNHCELQQFEYEDAADNQHALARYSPQELSLLKQQYSRLFLQKIYALPAIYQDVLFLIQFHNMTQQQVADHLHLSRLTVMKYLETALRCVLSVLLEEEQHEIQQVRPARK
jgi:RNA polymerase sigma factor (sigma-70 family)